MIDPMDCNLFKLLIQKYYEGELSPVERVEYESHRNGCESCRRLDSEFALIFSTLDGMPIYEPSEDFDSKVLSRVDISRYRRGIISRLLTTLSGYWYRLPAPARFVTTAGVILFVLIVSVNPALEIFIAGLSKGTIFLNWIASQFQAIFERLAPTFSAIFSIEIYEIAGRTILRAFKLTAGSEMFRVVSLTVLIVVLMIAFFEILRKQSRRKGETNVCVY